MLALVLAALVNLIGTASAQSLLGCPLLGLMGAGHASDISPRVTLEDLAQTYDGVLRHALELRLLDREALSKVKAHEPLSVPFTSDSMYLAHENILAGIRRQARRLGFSEIQLSAALNRRRLQLLGRHKVAAESSKGHRQDAATVPHHRKDLGREGDALEAVLKEAVYSGHLIPSDIAEMSQSADPFVLTVELDLTRVQYTGILRRLAKSLAARHPDKALKEAVRNNLALLADELENR